MDYPFEIREPDPELAKKLADGRVPMILVGPKKYVYLKKSTPLLPKFYHFEARPSDVWIYGYPRSGTTITQEIVWLVENDLNFEKAAEEVLDLRFPVLERENLFPRDFADGKSGEFLDVARRLAVPATEELDKMTGKRLIKTHLPFSLGPSNLLDSGCKILYLARNPKDVIVSNYNLSKVFRLGNYNFEQYWNAIECGLGYLGPQFEHLKEGWALRNEKNVLFLFFEDYKKDSRQYMRRIAEFLGKSLTDKQLDQLEEHFKIENFRKNKSVNNDHLRKLGMMDDEDDTFIRKGKMGGWRDYFTGSLLERVDKWIEDNLKNTDLRFPPEK